VYAEITLDQAQCDEQSEPERNQQSIQRLHRHQHTCVSYKVWTCWLIYWLYLVCLGVI